MTIICTCDHYMPPFEAWVKPAYNRDCAAYWTAAGTNASRIYDAVMDELFVHHSGRLFDHHREAIDLFAQNGGNDYIDCAFGKDPLRTLRRYLDRARTNRVHRLYKEHYGLVTLLTHARAIRLCRTEGLCVARAARLAPIT